MFNCLISIIQCLDCITHSVLPRNTFLTNRLHQQPPVLPACSGHLSIPLTLVGSGSSCGLLGVQKEKISTPEPKLPHTPSGHWWLYPGFLDIKWLFFILFCFVPETRYRHSHESQVMLWKRCLPEMPSALDIVSGSSHTHPAYHLLCLPVGCYLLFVCTF